MSETIYGERYHNSSSNWGNRAIAKKRPELLHNR